ncbi:membrane peptidoglycan carboxypeptidase [Motilibacter rhizosphaerae]|uniref:Membrane peptidoglycan carboxypeptidase n=1 Tax=Motilibacter rhizosphaerae TaxID=598652 RepID=A0A4Q7NW99_9ACTN|nr:membrane peptidoglycan carboxypeptidase [Motilibacter rhizosphaerae]
MDTRIIDYPRAGRRWPWKLIPSWRQVLLLGLVGVAVVLGAFAYAYQAIAIPEADKAAVAQSTQVFWSNGDFLGQFSGGSNRTNVAIKNVPPVLEHAVISAEDRDFYQNRGISPRGIARALVSNLTSDSKGQGGSTITQQFVRNYYQDVGSQKTYQRKVREAILAIKINQEKSKDQILQDYLNTIWWGRRSYGLQAAAKAWFPRGANDYKSLTLDQSAFLAAVIQAPDTFDYQRADGTIDATRQARAKARFDYVIAGMLKKGWITQQQAQEAKLPQLARPSRTNYYKGTNGYLLDYVHAQLQAETGWSDEQIEGGGYRIITTLDKDAQAAAVQAMKPKKDGGQFPDDASDVHAGLASIDVKTGRLIAMYGGPDYLKRQINDAVHGRAPGSSFKPFALAAGLKDGLSLYSTFWGNSPLPSTKTRNEFGQSYGSHVSLLYGLQESINTVYVDEAQQIGPKKVKAAIEAAGIPADTPGLQAVPSIPLGTADVSPLQMALGYSAFANHGVRAEAPQVIDHVFQATHPKRVTKPDATKTVKAFDGDVAADVTFALHKVVTSGTGTAALGVGAPVAAKTGTNGVQDNTLSAWFVGFTPTVATAVDFYRGDGLQDLDGVGGDTHRAFFGGGFPASVWTAYMKAVSAMPAYAPKGDFPPLACVNCNGRGGGAVTSEPSAGTSSGPQPSSSPTASAPAPSPSASPTPSAPVQPSPSPSPSRSTPAEPPVEAPGGGATPGAAAPQAQKR